MSRPDPGTVPRRPQHISSIAHLFFQEEDSAGEGAAHPAALEFAVAAAGVSPVSAFAAAGLALGSPRSAILTEDNQLRWSASSFLAREEVEARVLSRRDEVSRNIWNLSPAAGVSSKAICGDPSAPALDREFRWSHLGCLGLAGLAHLESLAASRSLIGPSSTGADGLVWCLLAKEACHLGSSYFLGRLVELIRPRQIEILLFPDAWSRAGLPGWIEAIGGNEFGREDAENLTRCAEIWAMACGKTPLVFHRVAGSDNMTGSFSGNREQKTIWQKIVFSMTAGSQGC